MSVMAGTSALDSALLDRLDGISVQLSQMQQELHRVREERARLLEITQLAGPVMEMLTERLTDLEARGYFEFATGGLGILDKVVTSFDADDVEALGDNVVLIVNTLKEMTQPEVMHLLSRTAVEVQEIEDAPVGPAPSTFALIRRMRDPEVRRGLGRALTVLRSLGASSTTKE